MATQSIFHNIIIQDSKTAEAFVTALENTADAADKITPKKVSSRDLSNHSVEPEIFTGGLAAPCLFPTAPQTGILP